MVWLCVRVKFYSKIDSDTHTHVYTVVTLLTYFYASLETKIWDNWPHSVILSNELMLNARYVRDPSLTIVVVVRHVGLRLAYTEMRIDTIA